MSQSQEKVITLAAPLSLGPLNYSSIMLREPTVDELDQSAQVEGTAYSSNVELIALVSGTPAAAVRKMGKSNYEEATAFLSGFTWAPPPSGSTSGSDAPTSPISTDGAPTPSDA